MNEKNQCHTADLSISTYKEIGLEVGSLVMNETGMVKLTAIGT